ncbi:MAG: pantoate--beta-alanine ligase [Dehalococcoidia bacterium]|nr:pantoate--beta-alanine ligase [Dehalococcoidia bacterium]
MQVIETVSGVRNLRGQIKNSVGFVPTMGYLHDGHLALVKRARAETDTVVVSIFVNPTQFDVGEDLVSYPRDLERDLEFLEREKTDIVFVPSNKEMYPSFSTWIDVEGITEKLEGLHRPGHFRGVATVVAKLFNIVQPGRAYFGQKDAQQVLVIKRMVSDLKMNLEIVVVPTVRESDGLAMSSRNVHLSHEERRAATVLFKALSLAEELWRGGEEDADEIRFQMTSLIAGISLASIGYISIANIGTLEEMKIITPPALVSLAVRIGKTRLIDNAILK